MVLGAVALGGTVLVVVQVVVAVVIGVVAELVLLSSLVW